MKAKDLAALLLQNPELDVYHEDYHMPEYSDGFHTVESVDGIKITPGGIFLDMNYIQGDTDNLKPPSQKPRIDSFRIKLNDDEFPYFMIGYDSDEDGHYFFEHFLNSDSYHSYVYNNTWMLYDENAELSEYHQNKLDETGIERFSLSDVEYVEVLTSFDDQWVPSYDKMSFADAMQYYITKYNIKKGENGY